MQVRELLAVLANPDRIRVFKDGKQIYCGYLGVYAHGNREEIDETAEVIKLQAILDIKHKEWEKRGLLPPIDKDIIAEYRFSDLQVQQYYDIYT